MSRQTPASYYDQLTAQIRKEKKALKRKKALLKAKLFFVIVLPCFLIFLLVKTAQTWIRLKLKSVATRITKPQKSQDQPPQ